VSVSVEVSVHDTRVPGGARRLAVDLRKLGAHVAGRAKRPIELSFAVIDDVRMQAVNRDTLGHDYPTDVLSFPMAEEPVLMGEILLSADTARREAAERGHPAYDELLLYAVHGVLHLLGYDDHDPAARRRMRRAERAALAVLGVSPVFGGRPRDPSS
jgi:probable rRNA maturation factor